MIWLYLGWLILLIGGAIAFYHQHPEHLPGRRLSVHLSFVEKEHLALHLLRLIGARFYAGESPPSVIQMARRLRVPTDVVEGLLASLERARLVVLAGEEQPGYLPGCPWEQASVHQALEAVRRSGRVQPGSRLPPVGDGHVQAVLDELERQSREAFASLSLKSFVQAGTDDGGAPATIPQAASALGSEKEPGDHADYR
jgi:membrane protein